MLKNPEHLARINALREGLSLSVATYQAARAALDTLDQNARTLRNSAAAAEADARQAREALRAQLQETMGKPSKQLHQKSAEHRAAIELSEEYFAIVADLEAQRGKPILDASDAAAAVIDRRKQLLHAYADAILAEAIGDIAPRLQLGLGIKQQLEGDEFFNDRIKVFWGDAQRLVMADLQELVASALRNPDLEPAELPEELRAQIREADLGGFKPLSPIERSIARKKLNPITTQEPA